ncbi:MAG: hypothetical protein QOG26_484, partial [Solirubrobacterales bacterium]|nr:hypothetical protein [Solirubrobacterales bacterium]
ILPQGAEFAGSTPDLQTILFTSKDRLDPSDVDDCADVYRYRSGAISLISTAGEPSEAYDARFDATSGDGSRALFSTREALPQAAGESVDSDQAVDIYERVGSMTTRLSTGEGGGNAELGAVFRAASRDANHVLFETREALVRGDRDDAVDVYDHAGGITRLITNKRRGTHAAHLRAISEDGRRVIFVSRDRLTASDHDDGWDLYLKRGARTFLVSRGPDAGDPAVFQRATTNASHVFFRTRGRLVATDRDNSYDVYDMTTSHLRLISTS